jgi:pimeloyl-ACP methyl ester carboxylesterase
MNNYTHQSAPTQFVEAAGIRFAYRRFGKKGGVPLLFFMHFTGTMDHWDPALTDGFAQDREVILFNNAGRQRSGWRKEVRQCGVVIRGSVSCCCAD